jgi:hypothetical protein
VHLNVRHQAQDRNSASLKLWQEEQFATVSQFLKVGGLVNLPVNGDHRLFFKNHSKSRVQRVHGFDGAAKIAGFDVELFLAIGKLGAYRSPKYYPNSQRLFLHRCKLQRI